MSYLFGRRRWLLLECQLHGLSCWLWFFNYAFLWVCFWQHNEKVMTFFTLDEPGGSWKWKVKRENTVHLKILLNVWLVNSALVDWLFVQWVWQHVAVISARGWAGLKIQGYTEHTATVQLKLESKALTKTQKQQQNWASKMANRLRLSF